MTPFPRKIILVEGKDDKIFFTKFLEKEFKELSQWIGIKDLGGINYDSPQNNLADEIQSILSSPNIRKMKIGIILDIDNASVAERISFINETLAYSLKDLQRRKENFPKIQDIPKLVTINEWVEQKDLEVKFAVNFTHFGGKGELADLLKAIKRTDINSFSADCLEHWRKCIGQKDMQLPDKEFSKLWLNVFIRYDVCTTKERQNAQKYCNLEFVLEKKNIFDFRLNFCKPTEIFSDYLLTKVNCYEFPTWCFDNSRHR